MSNSTVTRLPENIRDRDIFRDAQGRIFVALGYIQPMERILSYLKYIPDKKGKWQAGAIRYSRTFWGSVDSTVAGMEHLPPEYTIFDPHFQTDLVEPPRNLIQDYFNPELRLKEILQGPQDVLEERVKNATEFLLDELKIPLDCLGISGSILWKGHTPQFSDINMNIYGFKESWILQDNYANLAKNRNQYKLRTLPDWAHAIERIKKRIPPLTRSALKSLFSRRKTLCIKEQCIGITPILKPEEVPIRYGSESYVTDSHTPITLQMEVENADYSLFQPAIYKVRPVLVEEKKIIRVMVYDGVFCGLFKEGDRIEVSGTLQKINNPLHDEEHFQIMIGTKKGSGNEYIKFQS